MARPAIEENGQNHSWDGPENQFVEGLRDILLSWVEKHIEEATQFLTPLFKDNLQIVRRIAIHVLDRRFQKLASLYGKIVDASLFDRGHLHEMYHFLRNNFKGALRCRRGSCKCTYATAFKP
jgi:hypothetical protein